MFSIQGHLLKDQLEVVKVKTPEGGTRYTIKPLATELTFDKGLFVFVRAVQLLTHQNKDIIVVRRNHIPLRLCFSYAFSIPFSLIRFKLF